MFNPKKIIILDQAENPLHHLKLETESIFTTTKIRTVIGDVRNREAMDAIFKTYRPQFEYHATAYKHVPLMKKNPCQAIFTNILGAKNLPDLSCRYNVKKFVMVSTDKALNPSSVMGAGKRIAKK
jgi:FlaA1/EpsC-like NDP-sugar epimerase